MGLWLAAAEERRNWPEGREDCDCWHEQENTDSVEHDADVDAGYIRLQTTTNNATVDSTLRPRRYPGYIFLNPRRFLRDKPYNNPRDHTDPVYPWIFLCAVDQKNRVTGENYIDNYKIFQEHKLNSERFLVFPRVPGVNANTLHSHVRLSVFSLTEIQSPKFTNFFLHVSCGRGSVPVIIVILFAQ